MRRQGKSVVFVHHSGKGGGQRGSSKREDVLDVVIHLRRPERYAPDQGARFEISFEKFRNIFGEDVLPIEAALSHTPEGVTAWEWKPVRAPLDAEVEVLAKEGYTQREIARRQGVSAATVNRVLARIKGSGKSASNSPN